MKHNENDYIFFLMLATVLGQIKHEDTTRPIDKLRKQIRKTMAVNSQEEKDKIMVIARLADKHWVATQDKLGQELRVTTVASLQSIYDLMTPTQALIKEKLFYKALSSIEAKSEVSENEVENTANAFKLTEYLKEIMGIKNNRPNLSMLKNKVKNELILEGKIT